MFDVGMTPTCSRRSPSSTPAIVRMTRAAALELRRSVCSASPSRQSAPRRALGGHAPRGRASVSATITWRRSVSLRRRVIMPVVLELVEHRGHRAGAELGALGQLARGDLLVLGELDERAHLGGGELARAARVAAAQAALGAHQLAERGAQLVELGDGHATASSATSAGSGARERAGAALDDRQHDRGQQRDEADPQHPQ